MPSTPEIEAAGAVLRVSGDLDMASAPALAEAIDRQSDGLLCIDMRGVPFMDSTGAHVLIRAARSRGPNGCLIVHEPQPPVARVFDLLGLRGLANLHVVDGPGGPLASGV